MHTIENILNEYSKRNVNLFAYLKIAQKWNIIIGETLSKICYPSFYKNGILTLTVSDSVWANEISMNRLNIFKNIKKETDIIVSELRTRVGEIENEEYINSTDKNIYDNQNISKNEISEKHKNWILKVIKESNIDDKKIEEIFYRILENVKEDEDAN